MGVQARGGEHHAGMGGGQAESLLRPGRVGAGAHQPGHPGGTGPPERLGGVPAGEVQMAVAVYPGGHAVRRGNSGDPLLTGRPPG